MQEHCQKQADSVLFSICPTVLKLGVPFTFQLLLSTRNLTPNWGRPKAASFSKDTYGMRGTHRTIYRILRLGQILWPKKLDNTAIFFRKYDFIWPNHTCRSRQIFGGAKEFCPDSPKLAPKSKKTSKKKEKLIMSIRVPCDLQKKAVHVNWGAISCRFERHYFQIKAFGHHSCSDFQGDLEGSQRFCPWF